MLGIGNLAKLVFGTPNDRKVKSVRPLVAQINALEEQFRALSDADLIGKTRELQGRAQSGEDLDKLLPEAFAAVREAMAVRDQEHRLTHDRRQGSSRPFFSFSVADGGARKSPSNAIEINAIKADAA